MTKQVDIFYPDDAADIRARVLNPISGDVAAAYLMHLAEAMPNRLPPDISPLVDHPEVAPFLIIGRITEPVGAKGQRLAIVSSGSSFNRIIGRDPTGHILQRDDQEGSFGDLGTVGDRLLQDLRATHFRFKVPMNDNSVFLSDFICLPSKAANDDQPQVHILYDCRMDSRQQS